MAPSRGPNHGMGIKRIVLHEGKLEIELKFHKFLKC